MEYLVVIVVEGAEYEFDLLNAVFQGVLKYKLVTKSRNQKEYQEFNKYVMKGNENSSFIIINTKNSNIGTIEDDDKYRSEVYKMAYIKYDIDLKNCPMYFIWDRDCGSNKKSIVEKLICKLKNPYDNDNYENGLLLLSYPSVESFTISCFEKNTEYIDGDIKDYVNRTKEYKLLTNKKYKPTHLDKDKIRLATRDMINKINKLSDKDFEIDDIGNINKIVFQKEEEIFKSKKAYLLLSFVSYILLDLGIIIIKEES